jgi:hypothetical protein
VPQDYEQLGRAFCETLMDYYDDNPLKVNKLMPHLKKMRKEQRKARKALKAKRKAELVTKTEVKEEQEEEEPQQMHSDDGDDDYYQDFYEQQRMKNFLRCSLEDSFNWEELEEELHKAAANMPSDDEDDEGSDCDNDE